MEKFAALISQLDGTTSTQEKLDLLVRYFQSVPDRDALCALALLSGWRPRRCLNSSELRSLAAKEASLPLWLVEEAYHFTGDLAETLALLIPFPGNATPSALPTSLTEVLTTLQNLVSNPERARDFILYVWRGTRPSERFVFNKLLTGGFRIGVAQRMALQAFALSRGLDPDFVARRLGGDWNPLDMDSAFSEQDQEEADLHRPFPFCLAHPLELDDVGSLSVDTFFFEYKWDGIRGQLLRVQGRCDLWSRGGEWLNSAFPEIVEAVADLPSDGVLDGEILIWREGQIQSFQELQKRIGRKKPGPDIRRRYPAIFLAFDLLSVEGQDLRTWPLAERRRMLEEFLPARHPVLRASNLLQPASWEEALDLREKAKNYGAEGLMIKNKEAPYHGGRKRGVWWKWKVAPLTVDAVLLYAQSGHGRRAGLCTDFTFGLWHEGQLVPFAKAYSGLTDEEMEEVNRFIRHNTLEKFGPVRRVKPELVFELAFEGIHRSSRHKSGVAVRFPRILRWRHDKKAQEADGLEHLKNLALQRQPTGNSESHPQKSAGDNF
ncbi:MAG: ATP-dependent DNA ligase [Flavobacteriales bacterium]|nr:ATP-dependent DNA ligase [Flavobacteriales bacterium]MDW8432511.1 ATP-dependent DNA ligase [Flavobacteriales bacterium]